MLFYFFYLARIASIEFFFRRSTLAKEQQPQKVISKHNFVHFLRFVEKVRFFSSDFRLPKSFDSRAILLACAPVVVFAHFMTFNTLTVGVQTRWIFCVEKWLFQVFHRRKKVKLKCLHFACAHIKVGTIIQRQNKNSDNPDKRCRTMSWIFVVLAKSIQPFNVSKLINKYKQKAYHQSIRRLKIQMDPPKCHQLFF